jgi:hypothetical protein
MYSHIFHDEDDYFKSTIITEHRIETGDALLTRKAQYRTEERDGKPRAGYAMEGPALHPVSPSYIRSEEELGWKAEIQFLGRLSC